MTDTEPSATSQEIHRLRGDRPHGDRPVGRKLALPALIVWIGLIFGTSCTVVRPLEFFDSVQALTGIDESAMARFRVFWGVSWFAVVKGWHFAEFAILTYLCIWFIRWWRGSVGPSGVLAAMLFCIAFAISDEWHQTFVPDRFGTVQDVMIDSLGVLTCGGIVLWRMRRTART